LRLPIPYNPSCNQQRNNLLGTTNTKKQEEEDWVSKIIETFKTSLDYTEVYKNLNPLDTYDSWVYQGNKDDRVLGSYKEFLSYPYKPRKFDIGDYVSFDYGGEIHDWLITSLDKKLYYDTRGRIERCNITLKWQDDLGVIHSYPAVAKESFTNDSPSFNPDITINKGNLSIITQYNENTKFIPLNKRFLIGDPYQAIKVVAIINYTDTNTLGLDVIIDNKSPEDNEVLGIANYNSYLYSVDILESNFTQQVGYMATLNAEVKLNGQVVPSNVIWETSNSNIGIVDNLGNINLLAEGNVVFTCRMQDNNSIFDTINVSVVSIPVTQTEVIISPLENELMQGREQIYTVYLYTNGIQQTDTFTISHENVPTNKYQLNIIDGNTFKVTNLQMYQPNPLKITCQSGLYSKEFYIKLKGLW
jgi:hypothetical protein